MRAETSSAVTAAGEVVEAVLDAIVEYEGGEKERREGMGRRSLSFVESSDRECARESLLGQFLRTRDRGMDRRLKLKSGGEGANVKAADSERSGAETQLGAAAGVDGGICCA